MTWDKLGAMTAEEIRDRDAFPASFLPLPHSNHPESGGGWARASEISKGDCRFSSGLNGWSRAMSST